MQKPTFSLIIPAAGEGKRMESDIPKPYLRLRGKTVLERTLFCFTTLPGLNQVIVSTSAAFENDTRELLNKLFPGIQTDVVRGGKERQDSIYNALNCVREDSSLVAVHDAVRPFVSVTAIQNCLRKAEDAGGAILGVPVKDTIKKIVQGNVIEETPVRSELWQAQTPQIFERSILLKAYQQAKISGFFGTDDSSLVERVHSRIEIVESGRDNFKITYPLDFKIAELLLDEV